MFEEAVFENLVDTEDYGFLLNRRSVIQRIYLKALTTYHNYDKI